MFMPRNEATESSTYQPLSGDQGESFHPLSYKPRQRPRLLYLVIVQAVLIALLVVKVHQYSMLSPMSQLVYSPAQDAVKYRVQTFSSGSDENVYNGPPSDTVDDAWMQLYHPGFFRITENEALRIPNTTNPIPGDDGHYIADLEVFHSLHCLDTLRKIIYSDYYTDMQFELGMNAQHASHCLNALRQSLMCASDISIIVWRWDEARQANHFRSDIVHTCRNFEMLQDWALARDLPVPYNFSLNVADSA